MRLEGSRDVRIPDWYRRRRATLTSVVNGDVETGPPLLVFKGKNLSYRKIIANGRVCIETYAIRLPRSQVMTMREENGGVDGFNFY